MKNEMEKIIAERQSSEWDDVEFFHNSIDRLRDISVDFWNDAPGIDSEKITELEIVVRELRINFEIMMR